MLYRDNDLNYPQQNAPSTTGIVKCLSLFLIPFGLVMSLALVSSNPLMAQSNPGIAAIVNDEPISQFDISQRIKLNKLLGEKSESRKKILEELVEEQLQRQEAKRLRIPVTHEEIAKTIESMVKQRRSTTETFDNRLKKAGVNPSLMRDRVKALLAWQRILSRRFGKLVDLDEQDIDRAFQRAQKNRPPAQSFYMLQQITLPFDGALDPSSVQGRQIEAQRIIDGFKGCGSTQKISSGIYNVQIRNVGPVPVKQLQSNLRKLLRKAGPGKLLPPNITRAGIELLAYCSNKSVSAPEVTREQVRAGLASQQFGLVSSRHLRDLKRDAIVDYR